MTPLTNKIVAVFLFSLFSYIGMTQCYEHRHSTNWLDAWVSCSKAPNPNIVHSASHWILYDLEQEHRLDRTYFWNYNDVDNLGYGIQELAIDYSLDGSTWTSAGTYTIEQADGSPRYPGADGPNLGGIRARYLLFTALSNYGGPCFALSELRLEAQEISVAVHEEEEIDDCLQIAIFPNPVRSTTRIYFSTKCAPEISYQIVNISGQIQKSGSIQVEDRSKGYLSLETNILPPGDYIFKLLSEEGVASKIFIKI